MKERGILFSAPMVRALLDGNKTQTRRVFKLPPGHCWDQSQGGIDRGSVESDKWPGWWHVSEFRCPYGSPGDRLWVREAWSHDAESLEQCRASHEDIMGGGFYGPYYRATEIAPDTLHWKPSIHMPRWASRITLGIASVRVERLQEISDADALAEGVDRTNTSIPGYAKERYRQLWESINGPGSWDANPWVWVVEFRRLP